VSVWVTYLLVIFVWSTSPLAISWSSESLGPMTGLSVRLVVSCFLVFLLRLLSRSSALNIKGNWRAYLSGALGLFPAMALVYWASSHLPSSLVSVLFGLAPFTVVLINRMLSKKNTISFGQLMGMIFAFIGLAIVMAPSDDIDTVSALGVFLLLAAVVFYAISTILVKRYTEGVEIVNQLMGTILFALPAVLIALLFEVESISSALSIFEGVDRRAIYATLYLALMGSVVGFLSYYHLLKRISAAAVSLITMITPVVALVLGVWLNAEVFSTYIYLGIACIMLGLWLFRYFETRSTGRE